MRPHLQRGFGRHLQVRLGLRLRRHSGLRLGSHLGRHLRPRLGLRPQFARSATTTPEPRLLLGLLLALGHRGFYEVVALGHGPHSKPARAGVPARPQPFGRRNLHCSRLNFAYYRAGHAQTVMIKFARDVVANRSGNKHLLSLGHHLRQGPTPAHI